jgi:hypothetical protein
MIDQLHVLQEAADMRAAAQAAQSEKVSAAELLDSRMTAWQAAETCLRAEVERLQATCSLATCSDHLQTALTASYDELEGQAGNLEAPVSQSASLAKSAAVDEQPPMDKDMHTAVGRELAGSHTLSTGTEIQQSNESLAVEHILQQENTRLQEAVSQLQALLEGCRAQRLELRNEVDALRSALTQERSAEPVSESAQAADCSAALDAGSDGGVGSKVQDATSHAAHLQQQQQQEEQAPGAEQDSLPEVTSMLPAPGVDARDTGEPEAAGCDCEQLRMQLACAVTQISTLRREVLSLQAAQAVSPQHTRHSLEDCAGSNDTEPGAPPPMAGTAGSESVPSSETAVSIVEQPALPAAAMVPWWADPESAALMEVFWTPLDLSRPVWRTSGHRRTMPGGAVAATERESLPEPPLHLGTAAPEAAAPQGNPQMQQRPAADPGLVAHLAAEKARLHCETECAVHAASEAAAKLEQQAFQVWWMAAERTQLQLALHELDEAPRVHTVEEHRPHDCQKADAKPASVNTNATGDEEAGDRVPSSVQMDESQHVEAADMKDRGARELLAEKSALEDNLADSTAEVLAEMLQQESSRSEALRKQLDAAEGIITGLQDALHQLAANMDISALNAAQQDVIATGLQNDLSAVQDSEAALCKHIAALESMHTNLLVEVCIAEEQQDVLPHTIAGQAASIEQLKAACLEAEAQRALQEQHAAAWIDALKFQLADADAALAAAQDAAVQGQGMGFEEDGKEDCAEALSLLQGQVMEAEAAEAATFSHIAYLEASHSGLLWQLESAEAAARAVQDAAADAVRVAQAEREQLEHEEGRQADAAQAAPARLAESEQCRQKLQAQLLDISESAAANSQAASQACTEHPQKVDAAIAPPEIIQDMAYLGTADDAGRNAEKWAEPEGTKPLLGSPAASEIDFGHCAPVSAMQTCRETSVIKLNAGSSGVEADTTDIAPGEAGDSTGADLHLDSHHSPQPKSAGDTLHPQSDLLSRASPGADASSPLVHAQRLVKQEEHVESVDLPETAEAAAGLENVWHADSPVGNGERARSIRDEVPVVMKHQLASETQESIEMFDSDDNRVVATPSPRKQGATTDADDAKATLLHVLPTDEQQSGETIKAHRAESAFTNNHEIESLSLNKDMGGSNDEALGTDQPREATSPATALLEELQNAKEDVLIKVAKSKAWAQELQQQLDIASSACKETHVLQTAMAQSHAVHLQVEAMLRAAVEHEAELEAHLADDRSRLRGALAAAAAAEAVCANLQHQLLAENELRRGCEERLAATPPSVQLVICCGDTEPQPFLPRQDCLPGAMMQGHIVDGAETAFKSDAGINQPVVLHILVQESHQISAHNGHEGSGSRQEKSALEKLEEAVLSFEGALKSVIGEGLSRQEQDTDAGAVAPKDQSWPATGFGMTSSGIASLKRVAATFEDTLRVALASSGSEHSRGLGDRLALLRRESVTESNISCPAPMPGSVSPIMARNIALPSIDHDAATLQHDSISGREPAIALEQGVQALHGSQEPKEGSRDETFHVSCSELFEPMVMGGSLKDNPLFDHSPGVTSPSAPAPPVAKAKAADDVMAPTAAAGRHGHSDKAPDSCSTQNAADLAGGDEHAAEGDEHAAEASRPAPEYEETHPNDMDNEMSDHLNTLRGAKAQEIAQRVRESFAAPQHGPDLRAGPGLAGTAAAHGDRRPGGDEPLGGSAQGGRAGPGQGTRRRPWSLHSLKDEAMVRAAVEAVHGEHAAAGNAALDFTIPASWGLLDLPLEGANDTSSIGVDVQ